MSKFLIEVKARLASVRDDKGATAVEYVLLVGGIAAVLAAAAAAFGDEIVAKIQSILP